MPVLVKVRGIIKNSNTILLCKIPGKFRCLPGGTLEGGETRVECLKREIFEELGVEPIIGELLHMQEIADRDVTLFDYRYEILNPEDFENLDLSTASHGFELEQIAWLDPRSSDEEILPKNIGDVLFT